MVTISLCSLYEEYIVTGAGMLAHNKLTNVLIASGVLDTLTIPRRVSQVKSDIVYVP